MVIFDDIGSFPLPEGIDRKWVEENFITPEYEEMVRRAFLIRVCVTGPFELYYREFGPVIYDDILENISKSVERFASNAVEVLDDVCSISLDEPSLGLNPELQPTEDQLQLAYEPFNIGADSPSFPSVLQIYA